MWSMSFCATSLRPFSMRIFIVGSPCWACRASSVWIEEISELNSMSPTPIASAAIPRNCRLVNPVSKQKVSWMAVDTASLPPNMSSNSEREAMMPHSLVW